MKYNQEPGSPPSKKLRIDNESLLQKSVQQENEKVMDFTEDSVEVEDNFTIGDKYSDYVSPAELEKLREFRVLDEVKENEGDTNDEDSDGSEGKSEDLPEEEIEKMLDEDLPPELKEARKPKEKPYVTRTKIVLEEKGINQFEVLPLDWILVRHCSGMPVYMHRPTRVCTLSKPYSLGKENTRRHDIPISAIPCLAYRKALDEEEKQKEIDRKVDEQMKNTSWLKAQGLTVLNINEGMTTESEQKTDKLVNQNTSLMNKIFTNGKCPVSHLRNANGDVNVKSNNKDVSTVKDIKASLNGIKEKNVNGKVDCNGHMESNGVNKTNDANECYVKSETMDVDESDDKNGFNETKKIKNNVNDNNDVSTNDVSDNNNTTNANGTANGTANGIANGTANGKDPRIIFEDIPLNRQPVILPGGIIMPSPRVESVNSSWKTQHLTAEQITDYCKALFKFKTVQFMHFNRWADRRKYTKARKALQYPKLPEGTKLISLPSTNGQDGGGKAASRDWVMNMDGCGYLSEFHKFVCRTMHQRPVYEYKQLENAANPYQATVFIGGMQYGVGRGSSKRQAKYAAVKASMQILIPDMSQALDAPPASKGEPDFSFFDYVSIEDPRIAEFCAATCEPSPHAILLTCLLRNFGAGDWQPKCEMKKLEYQKIELTMTVGKHTATVVCKNKKTAKQRVSQSILQALHPQVKSWGSLLRLYGSRSVKSCKEKKLEEQQITLLQDKARHNEPNHAVLAKLRQEMSKLRARDAAVAPLGALLAAPPPRASASGLGALDL